MALRYDGVFFDLGGTLFQHLPGRFTDANLAQVLKGIEHGNVEVVEAQAVYRRCRLEAERGFVDRPFYLHKQIVLNAFASTLQQLDLPANEPAAHAFYERQRASVIRELSLRDETLGVLDSLRGQGSYLGIVSNIDDDYFVPLLEKTGLRTYMHSALSSESAGSCKPHAAIFRQAIAASGLQPDRLLYVGDSPIHDVLGARSAGMATAWLASGTAEGADPVAGASADYRIESLTELVEIVASY